MLTMLAAGGAIVAGRSRRTRRLCPPAFGFAALLLALVLSWLA